MRVRVSHLVLLGILLLVGSVLILDPGVTNLGIEHCDIMNRYGRGCPQGMRLVFHHVLIALAVGGAGFVSVVGALILFARRN